MRSLAIGALASLPVARVSTLVAAVLLFAPPALRAQGAGAVDADSVVERAQERQRAFEAYRASRIPPTAQPVAQCDERVGSICVWFGGENETSFPPEPAETAVARGELVGELTEAFDLVRSPWLAGNLVRYLVEAGNFRRAEAVARECGIAELWWCHALLGYVLHLREDFVPAEAAYREAAAAMPPEIREAWLTPTFVFTPSAVSAFRELDAEERLRQWELLWLFSDPLFLVEGNDRFTEHFTRLVVVEFSRESGTPEQVPWNRDQAEVLVRYGRNIGYSRTRMPGGAISLTLSETRSVIGHHHPMSRGYLFPEEFVPAPADIPPESWITAPRVAREWYAPPYAPDFNALETQVGRFRRGDSMFVVGAYRPVEALTVTAPPPAPGGANPDRPDPFARGRSTPAPSAAPAGSSAAPNGPRTVQVRGPVQSGFFLVPEEGGAPIVVRSNAVEGVFTMSAPHGRYVGSLEVFAENEERAWRARQGVNQASVTRGLVSVSDLMLLSENAPLPNTLDEAIPNVRAGVRVRRDERFAVVWEVYGLQVQQPVQVTLGFTEGRPGFLRRVGEFLGVLDPDRPVEITFADSGPDAIQTAFRAVTLQLPNLVPGEYTLHLRLDLPGREPVVTSRPITVE